MSEAEESNQSEGKRLDDLKQEILQVVRAQISGVEKQVNNLRESTRKSILLSDLIQQSEFETDEGNILKTLTRICTYDINTKITAMENELESHKLQLEEKNNNVHAKIDQIHGDIEHLVDKSKDAEWSHKLHSEMLTFKAEKADLKKVERMLNHYVDLNKFREYQTQVAERLSSFTKQDEFEIAQKNISELFSKVDKCATKNGLFQKEREIEDRTNVKLKDYTKLTAFHSEVNSIKSDIESIISKVASAAEDLREIRSLSDVMDGKLSQKVDKEAYDDAVDELWKEFNKYTSIEAIQALDAKLDPFMNKINTKLDIYDKAHDQNQHIISRFDEVLLEKASKFAIEQVYQALEMYINHATFENFKESCEDTNKATLEQIKKVESGINNLKNEVTTEVEHSIRRMMTNLKKSLFDYSGGRPVNDTELETLLKLKADKKEAEKLASSKASKDDLEKTKELVIDMESQLNNALVLFIECVKNNVLMFSDSKHKVVNKNASLLQQLNIIHKWVNTKEKEYKLNISEFFEDKKHHTVLPDTATKMFGKRRVSQNMRKINTSVCQAESRRTVEQPSTRHMRRKITTSLRSRPHNIKYDMSHSPQRLQSLNVNSPLESRRVFSPTSEMAYLHAQPTSASPGRNDASARPLQPHKRFPMSKKDIPKLNIGLVLKHKNKVIDYRKQMSKTEYITNDL